MRKLLIPILCVIMISCESTDDTNTVNAPQESPVSKLNFQFDFNENQERLNNIGQVTAVPSGNATQSPSFEGMGVHFIELAQDATTLYKAGEIVYQGAETYEGGDIAIDFDQAKIADEGETFHSISLASFLNIHNGFLAPAYCNSFVFVFKIHNAMSIPSLILPIVLDLIESVLLN